jgi:hypothetical protein
MKWHKLATFWILLMVSSTATVFAGDGGEVEFEFTADYFGKYIWRGQNLDDDPAFQPGFSACFDNFTAGIWGSLETTDYNGNSGEFTEVDYYLNYSNDIPGIEGVGFSVGMVYYDFPGTTCPGTTELYWGLNFSTILSPSVTFNHDIDEADGLYVSVGLGHSIENIFELCPDVPVTMELGANYGWGDSSYNKYYWGLDESKSNDLALSAAFPFEVGGWTVNPSLTYVTLVSDDIKDTNMFGTDDDFFFVGIGLAKGF